MFGLFSAKKPFNAQVNSEDSVIEIPAGENLLSAALDSGLGWPHNCRVGSCGTCRCRLVKGKIKPLNDFSYVLDKEELDSGMILACQTRLLSDVEIEIDLDTNALATASAETVTGTILSAELLTHDILDIQIQLDAAFPEFLAGQYAEITVDGIAQPRSYSFANAPSKATQQRLGFFVRHVPNGEMTSWLHAQSRVGERIVVNGPHGSFYLRESQAPMLCIAGGSGLAPIKALIEQIIDNGFNRQVTFLFGARTQKDLYCLDQMQQVAKDNPQQFKFIPILSGEPDDSDWTGPRGFVTEHITQQELKISDCQAYLCGPPPMIDSAIEVLSTAGLSEKEIFFDKFLDASHLPGGLR